MDSGASESVVNADTLKFYARYVDDTVLLATNTRLTDELLNVIEEATKYDNLKLNKNKRLTQRLNKRFAEEERLALSDPKVITDVRKDIVICRGTFALKNHCFDITLF